MLSKNIITWNNCFESQLITYPPSILPNYKLNFVFPTAVVPTINIVIGISFIILK